MKGQTGKARNGISRGKVKKMAKTMEWGIAKTKASYEQAGIGMVIC